MYKRIVVALFALTLCALWPMSLTWTPAEISAQSYPKHRVYKLGTLLSAVAMNGAAGTRTFTVGPDLGNDKLVDYGTLVLLYTFTHANDGALTTTCTMGPTVATATKTMTTCLTAAGTCLLQPAGVFTSWELTGDTEYEVRLGFKGSLALSCVTAHGGSVAAGDILTITGYVVTD